jgi:hypothetical protein
LLRCRPIAARLMNFACMPRQFACAAPNFACTPGDLDCTAGKFPLCRPLAHAARVPALRAARNYPAISSYSARTDCSCRWCRCARHNRPGHSLRRLCSYRRSRMHPRCRPGSYYK